MKNVLLPIIGASLIIFLIGMYVTTAEAALPKGTVLGAPSVSPNSISPGFDTQFFITETFPDMPANFRPVVQILTTSRKWKNIGRLRDDGKGGDPKAGDHVYSLIKRVKLASNAESISFRIGAKGEERTFITSPVRVVTRSGEFTVPQGWYHGGFNDGLGVVNFPPDQTPSDGPLRSGFAYMSANWAKKDPAMSLKDFALKDVYPADVTDTASLKVRGKDAIRVTSTSGEPAPDEDITYFIQVDNSLVIQVGVLFLASSPNRAEIVKGLEEFLSSVSLDVPMGGVR